MIQELIKMAIEMRDGLLMPVWPEWIGRLEVQGPHKVHDLRAK